MVVGLGMPTEVGVGADGCEFPVTEPVPVTGFTSC